MLKIVEIGIIQLPKGKNVMKQQVLKVLANPARIFYVPYNLAVFNFAVQFFLFFGLFIVRVLVLGLEANHTTLPILFFAGVIAVHCFIAIFSKKEPQLGQIVVAKIQLFKMKIPRKLVI